MRALETALHALVLLLFSVGIASAITIRLEEGTTPSQVQVFLDMDGDLTNGAPTQILAISVGVQSADASLTYLGAEPAPLLPTNATGILLDNAFQALTPTVAYGQASNSLGVPRGYTRALVNFFNPTPTDGINDFYGTTPENVLMATLNYDAAVFAEAFDLVIGPDEGFFIFDASSQLPPPDGPAVSIGDRIAFVNNLVSDPDRVNPIPEPSEIVNNPVPSEIVNNPAPNPGSVNPIPEPSGIVVMGLGLAVFQLAHRRKARREISTTSIPQVVA